jgi:hypothetical protein
MAIDKPISSDGVSRHEDSQRADIVLPQKISYDTAITALMRHKEAMETYVKTSKRYFKYLLDDGLVATAHCLDKEFGISFSSGSSFNPPESKSVKVSLTDAVEVPTGQISIPSLGSEAMVYVGEGIDPANPHLGKVFFIMAYVRRQDQPHITKFLDEVESRLDSHSIYRGQAVRLTAGGSLEYVDTSKYADPRRIVFNASVTAAIDRYVLGPIRKRNDLLERGVSQKRTALAYGPFGTGKSSLLQMAAREAISTGHTWLEGGPSVNMTDLMRIGALYGPSVVGAEDIDNVANTSEAHEVSALLEAFDGIAAKGADVKLVMTTNHMDRITPGMFRPGRIDTWLYIGPSDRQTMERIVRVNIAEAELAPDVDFDALWDVIEGFTPAYIHEVLNKAIIGAVVLSSGGRITVTTEDLLAAADVVRAQWQLQQDAVEPPKPPTLDSAFRALQVDAARTVLHSDESKVLLLETSFDGVRGNLDDIENVTRNGIEQGLNAAALYDKYGEDKKGQIVVE